MKRFLVIALIVFSFSLPSFAAKNSANVTLGTSVTVGSTQVAAGDYTVSWTGTDANVQVTIAKNGKVLVTVPAKLTPAKNGSTSVSTGTENGVKVLESIMLDKLTLDFSSAK